MSIQSEITRISGNVSSALESIAAKGVTVPSDSTSDDLADLIDSIVVATAMTTEEVLAAVTAGWNGTS